MIGQLDPTNKSAYERTKNTLIQFSISLNYLDI